MRITSGENTGDIYYQTITGLKQALSMTQKQDSGLGKEHPTEEAGQTNPPGGESESSSNGDEDTLGKSEGPESESETRKEVPVDKKAARKENKKKVKEEKREARKTKVPKAVKKRKKKLAKASKTR